MMLEAILLYAIVLFNEHNTCQKPKEQKEGSAINITKISSKRL